MIRTLSAVLAAAGVAVFAARQPQHSDTRSTDAPAAAASDQQDFHWSGRLGSGERIEIRNVVGEIRAEPSSGDEVTVTGERHGRDAEDVRIEMVRRDGGVVICAIYGSPDGDDGWTSHRKNDDDDGDDGPRDACSPGRHSHTHNTDASVDFTVHVPAGVRLVARNVSGDVEASGLRGEVDASSVSGNVHVSTAGAVEASSVSGNVVAALGRTSGHDLDFRSVSGNVTLEVPEGIDADFRASTLSGEIESDFPMRLGRGSRGKDDDDDDDGSSIHVHVRIGQQAHGRLGRGGPELSVSTISGNVTLRKAR
jgi:hypothetical protein